MRVGVVPTQNRSPSLQIHDSMGERQGGYNRQKETTIHRSSSSDSERHTTKTKSKMLSSLLQGFGRQGSHSAKIVGMAMTVDLAI